MKSNSVLRRLWTGVLGFLAVMIIAAAAQMAVAKVKPGQGTTSAPAVLVMIDEAGCPYCARWRSEIGVHYGSSPEGRFAPLVTYDISDDETDAFKRVIYTPTFIVIAKGREVGRITGYPGANFFYPLLDKILAKIGFKTDEDETAVTR